MAALRGLPAIMHFSSSYDATEMTVVPSTNPYPRIHAELYEMLKYRDVQDNDAGSPGKPVLFNAPGQSHTHHFEVIPDDSVPIQTIELPNRIVENTSLGPFPTTTQFLIAKPRHAVRIHRMSTFGQASLERQR